MSFILRAGKTKTLYLPKVASTAFSDGALVTFNGSGYITPATSSSTKVIGVCRKTVASTDTDFASNTLIPVQVPVELYVEWEALTASAVASDVGVAVDLTDSVTVNRGGTAHHVVTIVGLISATKVVVVLNALSSSYAGA